MTATVNQPLDVLAEVAGETAALDVPAKPIGKAVRDVGPGTLKDVLSGTWMGHALHPILTDVVIGSWTSASMLDLLGGPGTDKAARRLLAVGIAAYPLTAVTGLSDWADSEAVDSDVRRVGLVHAAVNAVALGFYTSSLTSRRKGRRGRGIAMALAGAGVMTVGGHLGGHLAYRLGVGVDQTSFDRGPDDWTEALHADALADEKPLAVQVGATPVMLVRDGDQVLALHDRCSHRGCSLTTGDVHAGAVTCACHGSRFDLRTGSVLRGPATAPQPVLDVRTREGHIQVRRPHV